MFIKPMLASPMPANFVIRPGEWSAEEKADGHRVIIYRGSLGDVYVWSRYGLLRALPSYLNEALADLPPGTYDGELLSPNNKSYGVTVLGAQLYIVIFDVLTLLDVEVMSNTYAQRRKFLEETFKADHIMALEDRVRLGWSKPVNSMQDIVTLTAEVYGRGGEGLILKKNLGTYRPGKRGQEFIKIKKLLSAVLTVIGFEPGKGEVIDRGPYAVTLLRDAEGNETKVKTLNDKELRKLEEASAKHGIGLGLLDSGFHPAVGRKLRIEYQERTSDGSYRHPRWDRWEKE